MVAEINGEEVDVEALTVEDFKKVLQYVIRLNTHISVLSNKLQIQNSLAD